VRVLITTTDAIKLSAVQALLASEGVASDVFDAQAGGLWRSIIPQRLMVENEDVDRAKRVLRVAGFVEAADGDWDLRAR
jgi:type III secretory pathway lipoprotein EscJ